MKNKALLDEFGRVTDVKPSNEVYAEWAEKGTVVDLPSYAGLDWIYRDGEWFQPSGKPPTEGQLTYVISAGSFIGRLTELQAAELFDLAPKDGRVAKLLLSLSSLREGIYSTDVLTLEAKALAEALWGAEEAARLFAEPTTDEKIKDGKSISKTPTKDNAPHE